MACSHGACWLGLDKDILGSSHLFLTWRGWSRSGKPAGGVCALAMKCRLLHGYLGTLPVLAGSVWWILMV